MTLKTRETDDNDDGGGELNVVGALFAQNGEDNGYDPEDFVQEIAVDDVTHFRISVAEDDGSMPGALFACAVWNGAVMNNSTLPFLQIPAS